MLNRESHTSEVTIFVVKLYDFTYRRIKNSIRTRSLEFYVAMKKQFIFYAKYSVDKFVKFYFIFKILFKII